MSVALLVAESVWFTPQRNKGQVSFNEYSQAIENLLRFGPTNDLFCTYRAGFYDNTSLEKCLDHLTNTNEERQILYIGAHGDGNNVSDASIKDVSSTITKRAGRIKGLVVSSCWAAQSNLLAKHANWGIDNRSNIINGPNWIVSYKHAVDWHLSALLEMHILYSICKIYCYDPQRMNSGDGIINAFKDALEIFNPQMKIGINRETLSDTLRIWIRPKGSDTLKDVTTELCRRLVW
jgi:hypothetical protein